MYGKSRHLSDVISGLASTNIRSSKHAIFVNTVAVFIDTHLSVTIIWILENCTGFTEFSISG